MKRIWTVSPEVETVFLKLVITDLERTELINY